MRGSFAKYAGAPVLSRPCQVELNRCDPQNESREVKRGRTTHHNRGEHSMFKTPLPKQTQETAHTTQHDAVAAQEDPTQTRNGGQQIRSYAELHLISPLPEHSRGTRGEHSQIDESLSGIFRAVRGTPQRSSSWPNVVSILPAPGGCLVLQLIFWNEKSQKKLMRFATCKWHKVAHFTSEWLVC